MVELESYETALLESACAEPEQTRKEGSVFRATALHGCGKPGPLVQGAKTQ